MDQDEEEAKELPKIKHERAIQIAGSTIRNVLYSFDKLDRVNIIQNVLDEISPFSDIYETLALKNVYLDCHRNNQVLYSKEWDKADAEFDTRKGYIDE